MKIRFPFPDKRLSPNSRLNHLYQTSARKEAREIGYWICKDAGWKFSGSHPLEFHMTICPPDKRHRDDDNMLSRFKSYRDGIFLALQLDDRLIRRTVIDFGDIEKGGAVYIELMEMK